jgi:hypothetical protein
MTGGENNNTESTEDYNSGSTNDVPNAGLAQTSTGTKRKQEEPKKPPTTRALLLYYETVRGNTDWADACTQWKQMSKTEKEPFQKQARDELVSFLNSIEN